MLICVSGLIGPAHLFAQKTRSDISTATFRAEVRDFFAKEVAAHFADIKSYNPPQERVVGAQTTGDFSWGSFARTLAVQADIGGSRAIAGKDTARAIAEMGLIESRKGGKSFAQLYSTEALRRFGTDLSKNAVWQSMSESERNEWHSLLDPARFYDAQKRQVINLPENYLGVAARVSAMSYQLGVLKDRAFLDSVVERAAEQFINGAIYADDNQPTGRYDRYSNEYARFCWDAANLAGRNDIKEKLKPTLKTQMKLWWDLVSPSGYGYNWGRSQGLVSYLDTPEIVAFLAENPEFRPAQLPELAALAYQAWLWLRHDYNDKTHLFDVFGFGRGNYSYINRSREWQQTGVGLAKLIIAEDTITRVLVNENTTTFPSSPALARVARFEYFADKPDKKEGVWLYRDGKLRFALPITVGTKPAIADYLPAPFGLAGFAAPVEEVYPTLVPFVKLSDGKTYAAADGADSIEPGRDGLSLKIANTRWAQVDSKSGERFENGLKSDVEFRVVGGALIRRETLTALRDLNIEGWRVTFPTTGSQITGDVAQGYTTLGRDGTTAISFKLPPGTITRIEAMGDSQFGKGVLGAIPLHIVAEKQAITLARGQSLVWEIRIEPR